MAISFILLVKVKGLLLFSQHDDTQSRIYILLGVHFKI